MAAASVWLVAVCVCPASARAQGAVSTGSTLADASTEPLAELVASARPDTPAVLTLANRGIVVLRAAVLGRGSADRVHAAHHLLVQRSRDDGPLDVTSEVVAGASFISVGGQRVFAILPADLDRLVGESIESKTADTTARLRQALDEIAEARRPRLLLIAAAQVLAVTTIAAFLLWGLQRVRSSVREAVERRTRRRLSRSNLGDELVRQTQVLRHVGRSVTALAGVGALAVAYAWLTFSLRRFPYTRPWGESLRAFLMNRVMWLGDAIIGAVPDLLTIVLVLAVMRVVLRWIRLLFFAAEQGRINLPMVHAETAATTRRLFTGLIWLFTLAICYPYLPGSETEAFKGVSVFLGVMVSFGSTGIVSQMMSGLTLTYSRALRTGDFVRVGEIEGTVSQMGALSTKIETPRQEEITIPNAVLINQTVTNYSRHAGTLGVFVGTSVAVGYNVPWRQVEALLLLAVGRTAAIRREPAPFVWQTDLEDFAVRYAVRFCLEVPRRRGAVLAALHANILDAFNDYGVQIMTPNYESDPGAPKVVAKERWYAEPAHERDRPATSPVVHT